MSNGQMNNFVLPKNIIDRTAEFSEVNIWITLNNNESIDGYTRIGDSIYGGEIGCDVKPLEGIDIKTFKILAGTGYAKDIYKAYFPIQIMCTDGKDCGICNYSKVIVKGANPANFKYLKKDYATDGDSVFFRGKMIKNADAATFKVIDGPEYFYFAVDKNYVYKHDKIFEDADPSTFYYDETDSRNEVLNSKKYIIGDKSNEWQYTPPHQILKIEKK